MLVRPQFLSIFLVLGAAAAVTVTAQAQRDAQRPLTDDEWCRDARSSQDNRETFCEVRELTMAKPGVLDVTGNPNGGITITASNRSDIRIRARVASSDRSASEAESIGRSVRVTAENGRVRTEGPRGGNQRWWVSYRIEVPASQDLELETSNGAIAVTGVNGRIRAETSNGSLRLTDLGGDVVATTSNGSAHAQLGGTTWNGSGLRMRTSNGSVRIDLPDNYNARLVAGTSNGSLSSDIPLTMRGRISREIETTLGNGGPTIEVRSSNGSVRIGRR